MVNAAKHSGADKIDVYAEVDEDSSRYSSVTAGQASMSMLLPRTAGVSKEASSIAWHDTVALPRFVQHRTTARKCDWRSRDD